MALTLITAPGVEPVTVDEAKVHLNLTHNEDDQLIAAMITAARSQAETTICRRSFITTTWELVLDQFPASGELSLPMPPLQSVTSVKYIDTDAAEQTMSTDDYDVDTDSEPGRVLLSYGKTWPSTLQHPQSVRVRYVAGYGDSGSDVPAGIRAWIKCRVATLYENREGFVVGQSPAVIPHTFIDGLLDPYRFIHV